MNYLEDQGHGSQNSPTSISSDFEHYESALAVSVPLDYNMFIAGMSS